MSSRKPDPGELRLKVDTGDGFEASIILVWGDAPARYAVEKWLKAQLDFVDILHKSPAARSTPPTGTF